MMNQNNPYEQKTIPIYRDDKYVGNIMIDKHKRYTEEEYDELLDSTVLNGYKPRGKKK